MRPKHKVKKLKQLQSSVYGVHLNAKYLISTKQHLPINVVIKSVLIKTFTLLLKFAKFDDFKC